MSHAATVNHADRVLSDDKRRRGRISKSAPRNDITQSGQWHKGRRVYEYQPGSWWSRLLYGLGTLAFLVVPPLLPWTTVVGLIKGYMVFLVVSYGIVCVWGILRSLRTPAGGRSARH